MTENMVFMQFTLDLAMDFKRNCMEAQRVFNLQDTPMERLLGVNGIALDWPSEGELEFKDVHLRYRPNCEKVLNGISFKVEPGQKVGIVGRTGAGKSTMFMALSRIVELESGSIEIDGQDISKLNLKAVRDQITMIPQDPTLFTGTLRFNLDPFDEHPDERLLELIKKAGLDVLLNQRETNQENDAKQTKNDSRVDDGGKFKGLILNFKVQEEGKNLSVGERQLICIVRAVLRSNKIVVLDEATANIDVVTERAIQKLIDEEIRGATMLTIAHRLNTIIQSDKVLFLSEGKVLEFDSPQRLLANPHSAFAKLAASKQGK